MIKTAILVDGAFYRKRAYYFWGDMSPRARAEELERYCKKHIEKEKAGDFDESDLRYIEKEIKQQGRG